VEELVDIHAHVLPGIDDGPSNLEGALAMAQAAAESGTRTLVSTPHLRSDFPDVHLHELGERCQGLRAAIEAERIPLRLVCGAEVSLVWALEASHEELVLASYHQRGTDLLIETPLGTVSGIDQHLFRLRADGFRITLAHPERSGEFQTDVRQLEELIHQEVLLQVNAGSLFESRRSSDAGRFARQLCSAGLIHALASDGHRAESWRPVSNLREGAEAAAALVGAERAAWMARDVPAAIVDGTELPQPPEISPSPRRKRLFGRRS
jgi:protein-tyrosine phosphatase